MIVLGLLTILIFYQISLLRDKEKHGLVRVIVKIGFLNTFFVLFHQMLMWIQEKQEYGTDALHYWLNVSSAVDSGFSRLTGPSLLFQYFSYFITITSPFHSIIFVRLGNILLLLSVLINIYHICRLETTNQKVLLQIITLIGYNGIVIWTAIRHLKDIFFVFLVIWLIFICYLNSYRKTIHFKHIIVILCSFIAFNFLIVNVRPWGFVLTYVIALSWLLSIQFSKSKGKIYIALIFIVIIALLYSNFAFFYSQWNIFTSFRRTVYSNEMDEPLEPPPISAFEIIKSVATFLVGPGPWNALMGHRKFIYTTTLGNYLIFFGALSWWIYLPRMVLLMFFRIKKLHEEKPLYGFAATSLTILIIYAIAFGGSLDTRFRSTIYILLYPIILLTEDAFKFQQPIVYQKFFVPMIFIFTFMFFVVASYFSYLTLKPLL